MPAKLGRLCLCGISAIKNAVCRVQTEHRPLKCARSLSLSVVACAREHRAASGRSEPVARKLAKGLLCIG